MKRHAPFVVALAVPVLIASLATRSPAQDTEALSIHGFGGWAAGYTNNDNAFNNVASNDFEVENYYFTLNLFARPAETVSIHAQPTWQSSLRGKEVSLDLVYVEWTLVPDLRLRAGKIKNPLGIYTEIYKVGTLRPFYLLPNAMYRNVPEAYTGAGLNRVQSLGSWEAEIDILGGQMEFDPSTADMIVGLDPETGQPIFASIATDWEGRDFFGGGLIVRPPVDGLELSLSAYSLDIYAGLAGGELTSIGDERTDVIVGGLEYVNERVSFRAEAFTAHGPIDFDTGFVEAAFKLDDHWQVAAQYDILRRKDPEAIVDALSDHAAVGIGLNYWVNPKVVWKADYYRVTDNYLARPSDAVNLALAGNLEKDTDVFILGAHFSF